MWGVDGEQKVVFFSKTGKEMTKYQARLNQVAVVSTTLYSLLKRENYSR